MVDMQPDLHFSYRLQYPTKYCLIWTCMLGGWLSPTYSFERLQCSQEARVSLIWPSDSHDHLYAVACRIRHLLRNWLARSRGLAVERPKQVVVASWTTTSASEQATMRWKTCASKSQPLPRTDRLPIQIVYIQYRSSQVPGKYTRIVQVLTHLENEG